MIELKLSKYEALALVRALSKANALDRLCDGRPSDMAMKVRCRLELALADRLELPWGEGFDLARAVADGAWSEVERRIYPAWYYSVHGLDNYLDTRFAAAAGHTGKEAA